MHVCTCAVGNSTAHRQWLYQLVRFLLLFNSPFVVGLVDPCHGQTSPGTRLCLHRLEMPVRFLPSAVIHLLLLLLQETETLTDGVAARN